MELRHLRYFIAVAEEGSLTHAAEKRLHTAQPSLSRQIRDLENEVGVGLMHRSVHGIELTAAGKAFLDNMAMAIALVASTRGLALMPAYAKNLLPSSVVSRPLEGEAPTIELAVGYSKTNTSPLLKLSLSRMLPSIASSGAH